MARIAKRALDAAQMPEVRRTIRGDTLKGLGVILRPSGVHSFVVSYRNDKNRKRNITIAKVGSIAPDMARKKAEEFRAMLLQARDPVEEKRVSRDTPSASSLMDAHLVGATFKGKREATQSVDRIRIEGHLRPILGGLRVDEITMQSVERGFSRSWKGVTRPRTASREGGGSRRRRDCPL